MSRPSTGGEHPREVKLDREADMLDLMRRRAGPGGTWHSVGNLLVEYRCNGDHSGRAPLLGGICETPEGPMLVIERRASHSRAQIAASKSQGADVPHPTFPITDLLLLPEGDADLDHELRCRAHGVRATVSRNDMLKRASAAAAKRTRQVVRTPLTIRV